MRKHGFISYLCLLFVLIIRTNEAKAQSDSLFSAQYFKALKNKNLASIANYFVEPTDQIRLMSWPNTPRNRVFLDSLDKVYCDSLLIYFAQIEQQLKAQQFNLKKAKLLRYKRNYGTFAYYHLFLNDGKKEVMLQVGVMDQGDKDFLQQEYPKLVTALEWTPRSGMQRVINKKSYNTWTLRNVERHEVQKILMKNKPLVFEGDTLSAPFPLAFFTSGIIKQKQYWATVSLLNKSKQQQYIAFINLEEKKLG